MTKNTNTKAAQHTPGPWHFDEDALGVFAPDGAEWLAIYDADASTADSPPKAEQIANARLIAAAPELLAACYQAVKNCSYCMGRFAYECKSCAPIRAAIFKAVGREG